MFYMVAKVVVFYEKTSMDIRLFIFPLIIPSFFSTFVALNI